ncbi:hypothetical protein HDU78_002752 [Chytriomyces hyalinus]|nr:hypothetical protein HDU78_002752 [Chytriomyces hyalinus]
MITNEEARYGWERVLFLESTVAQLCKEVSHMKTMLSTVLPMVLSPDTDDKLTMDADNKFESTSNLDPMDDDEPPDDCLENKQSTRHHSITPQPVQGESNDPKISEMSSAKAPSEPLSEDGALPDDLDMSDVTPLQFSTPVFTDIPPHTVAAKKSSPTTSMSLEKFLKHRAKHFMGVNARICVAFQNRECHACEELHDCMYCLYKSSVHGFVDCPRKKDALKEFQFHV